MKQLSPNAATLAAIAEVENIFAGQIQAKRYSSARELFDELDAENEDE